VLELLKRGYVRIERDGQCIISTLCPIDAEKSAVNGDFFAKYTPPSWAPPGQGVSPYLLSRPILKAQNLRDAVQGVETYISRKIYADGALNG